MTNNYENSLSDIENIFSKVFDHFNCSICLNELETTFLTIKCSHRFCENCIKTSVDQHHKCPLCNQPLTINDLIRDNHFDNLKNDIKVFKEKKMQSVFDRIVNDLDNNDTSVTNKELSPLQNVLKNHLINSLLIHENYTNQLKANFDKEIQRIEKKTDELISNIGSVFLVRSEIEAEVQKVIQNSNFEKENLKKDFNRQINSIAKKYKKYLEQSNMSPLALPVKIKIRLMCKNLIFDSFELKPNDDVNVILDHVKQESKVNLRDEIVEFPNDLVIFNLGSFSKFTNEEANEIYNNYLNYGELPDQIEVINSKNCFPILEHSIKPNSEILIFGNFKFESDMPKRCFKYTFDKNNLKCVDYFQCQNCNLKWICKSCVDACHQGHNLKTFSLNHNSNWACCFCDRHVCCLKEA